MGYGTVYFNSLAVFCITLSQTPSSESDGATLSAELGSESPEGFTGHCYATGHTAPLLTATSLVLAYLTWIDCWPEWECVVGTFADKPPSAYCSALISLMENILAFLLGKDV